MRPTWDETWMSVTESIAARSVDDKLKVGALIVTKDNMQVLAVGYNGDEVGGPNCRDSMETGLSGFVHAEANALIKFDYNNSKPKKLYVTHSPCRICARMIVNAGIEEIIYKVPYEDDLLGLEILQNAALLVRKF